MGRFHIYAHNELPDGILEAIGSSYFITSTSVTLSPSRHIFWEVMFGRFSTQLFYKCEATGETEKVLATHIDEALDCLERFASLKNNPFTIPEVMSEIDMVAMISDFANHVKQRLYGDYIIYNISEVLLHYDAAKTESEIVTAIASSKDFYTKILTKQPFTYREAMYALTGTLFRCSLTNLIQCVVEKPTSQDIYNALAGVEDM
jgi:hypothetical protein